MEWRRKRISDVRHPDKVERWPGKIPDVRHSDGMAVEKDSGCETSGWNGGGEGIPGARHQDGMAAEKDSGCETFG